MAKSKQGQLNESTGKVESRTVRKVKEVDFPVTVVDTRLKRLIRKAVG